MLFAVKAILPKRIFGIVSHIFSLTVNILEGMQT